MPIPPFTYAIEPLAKRHNPSDFCCGVEALDRYLHEQASQDVRRYLAAVFVLQDLEQKRLAGYYTIAATAILLADLPLELTRKLPKYPKIPAVLLGRLAVDERYQGLGLGTFLLFDALHRSYSSEVASMAVVVEAKNDQAQAFYEYHQFSPFPQQPRRLYLPMTTIKKMLG